MENSSDERKIEISREILNDLDTTRKWTTFLSILGFILFGLMIIASLAAGLFLTIFRIQEQQLGIPESLLVVILLASGMVYFASVLFLFRFSKSIRDAIQNLDRKKLEKGFRNLRLFFTIKGITVIVYVIIYVIALIAAGASISFLKDI